jgi:hypothetical protein
VNAFARGEWPAMRPRARTRSVICRRVLAEAEAMQHLVEKAPAIRCGGRRPGTTLSLSILEPTARLARWSDRGRVSLGEVWAWNG